MLYQTTRWESGVLELIAEVVSGIAIPWSDRARPTADD